ncbi:MAG TPA: helix-turn-helix-type transcriptional regulator, partial [Achromobacter sp.]|nr:helix-turn-helix-type transcriptional regulator [Achromobacter sp.]
QGCLVARIPAQLNELAPLCRSAVVGANLGALAPASAIEFDEEALAKIMAMRNPITCECPRHLAELLM